MPHRAQPADTGPRGPGLRAGKPARLTPEGARPHGRAPHDLSRRWIQDHTRRIGLAGLPALPLHLGAPPHGRATLDLSRRQFAQHGPAAYLRPAVDTGPHHQDPRRTLSPPTGKQSSPVGMTATTGRQAHGLTPQVQDRTGGPREEHLFLLCVGGNLCPRPAGSPFRPPARFLCRPGASPVWWGWHRPGGCSVTRRLKRHASGSILPAGGTPSDAAGQRH